MGKTSNKSTAEVAPAAVFAPSFNSAKKGKRNAEVVLEKPVTAKKQKKVVVEVQIRQNADKRSKKVPLPKKKIETSSSEDASSDSEEDAKSATKRGGKPVKQPIKYSSSSEESSDEEVKPANLFKKLPAAGVKNGSAVASKKKEDSSDEDSDSSSDKENVNGQKTVAGKKVLPIQKNGVTQDSSSETSESESDDEEVTARAASVVKKPPSKVSENASNKKEEASESSDSDSDDEDDAPKISVSTKSGPAALQAAVTTASKKKDESSDNSESDSDSGEDMVPPAIPLKKRESTEKKPQSKAKVEGSSEDSSDESSSESDEEPHRKKLKVPETIGLNASKPTMKSAKTESSSSDVDEDDSYEETSDDETLKVQQNKVVKPSKQSTKSSNSSDDESSEEDSSDESGDEQPIKIPAKKVRFHSLPIGLNASKPTMKSAKTESSSSDDDEDDSYEETSDDETLKVQQDKVVKPSKQPTKSSNSSDDESSEEDSSDESGDEQPIKIPVHSLPIGLNASKHTMKSAKMESSSGDDDEDDHYEETSDDETLKVQQNKVVKPSKQPTKSSNSSDDESSEEDSSDESGDEQPIKIPAKKEIDLKRKDAFPDQTFKNKPSKQLTKSSRGSDEESSEEDSSEEDSSDENEDEQPIKTPAKKETDLKRKDAYTDQIAKKIDKRAEKTPVGTQNVSFGSKILFVGNLSYNVGENELMEFFQEAGEVADVRLSRFDDGHFKGFGHVEFATAEAAQRALHDLNGQELLGRSVRLNLARERGSYTPNSGAEIRSFQKAGKGQSHTIFVRGIDNSLEMAQIESSLQECFGSCGEITRISLPRDYETGGSKGIGYIDFKTEEAFSKALELSGSELGGYTLTVEEARPKGDSRSGGRDGGGWGGRGGRDSGGWGGRGGGRGGRDGGGWGGRGGGRGRDGGGRRGRGGGGRFGAGTPSQGKKTTFGDD